MVKSNCIILLLFLFGCSALAEERLVARKTVSMTDSSILVSGANYVERTEAKITFSRFNEDILALPSSKTAFNATKARTTTGVSISFETNSPNVELTFVKEAGINRGADFGIFKNGSFYEEKHFSAKECEDTLRLQLNGSLEDNHWRVTLPSLCNVALVGLALDDAYSLSSSKIDSKPVYIALGNSITHGVGQKSATYLTYPFLLSEALGFELYNLAVGGAKVSQALAEMLSEMPQAHLITLLIGYNDMHSNNKSIDQFRSDYRHFLKSLRQHQPNADVYCISMTYTRSLGNETTGIVPDDYRQVVKEVAEEWQKKDDKFYFVAGDKLTSEKNLKADQISDKVHFGIEGAAMFAKALELIIE